MKFTNTKAQVKEVGTNAVAFGKAGYNLVKSVVKVPVAVGKDISAGAKLYAEVKRELKARQKPDEA